MNYKSAATSAFLAASEYETQLLREIGKPAHQYGQLYLVDQVCDPVFWAQNEWINPVWIEIESIADAAKKLGSIQRNWAPYSFDFHRRTQLIQSKLPFLNTKPKRFPYTAPTTDLGAYCLVTPDLMLVSPQTKVPVPDGRIIFQENHEDPPSRAYLKLYEALAFCEAMPTPEETCIELGASPGGWTWVLAQLGTKVTAVDRAPLDPSMAQYHHVTFQKGNAFAMTPGRVGAVDWIFSDIICYPGKLLEFVQEWVASGSCSHIVCTIKYQGDDAPYAMSQEFAAIAGSHVRHLGYNKHELTWIWHRPLAKNDSGPLGKTQ